MHFVIIQCVCGHDAGAERAEGIAGFAGHPLARRLLQIAGGDIVCQGVAEDMLVRLVERDIGGALADDDGDLRFIVVLFRAAAADHLSSVGRKGIVELGKDRGHAGGFKAAPGFLDMRTVVDARAEDLGGRVHSRGISDRRFVKIMRRQVFRHLQQRERILAPHADSLHHGARDL